MVNLKFYTELIDAIAVSEELQTKLKFAVKEAFEAPRSFYDQDGEYLLVQRGLNFSENAHLTAKFVLIDKLIEADQMAEIDWKEDEKEIRPIINRILKAKNCGFEISGKTEYEDEDTFNILDSINRRELRSNGCSLQILDIDSDSYVFTVTPAERKKLVAEMFEKLK